ncbi:hypothetical protein EZS27_009528 [termite gut metagenome]|uniref:NigD-like C-terminal beta sandwich domain-containing protein n=1 Tax=termite gut metagenome TaxID=433724 RepID=A0A5J4S9D3_9ZZZZ
MKSFKFLPVISAMLFAFSMQSCLSYLDDDENNEIVTCPPGPSLAIATIKVIDDDDYYFGLDNGATMYPADKTIVSNYKAKDGQRALVYFDIYSDLTDKLKVEGYDYSIRVFDIKDILTKNIIPLTEETADSIGDDKINAVSIHLTKEYLTIQFQFLSTDNPNKLHMLNLVQNLTIEEDEDNEYLNLEFRHNAYDDAPMQLGENYVSFKLDDALIAGKKGVKVRINTIYNGIVYKIANFIEGEE